MPPKGGKGKGKKKRKPKKQLPPEKDEKIRQLELHAATGDEEQLREQMGLKAENAASGLPGEIKTNPKNQDKTPLDFDFKRKAGSVFVMAVQYNQEKTADIILKNGGEVNWGNGKALMQAVRAKNIKMVKWLIDRKANVNNASDFTRTTALMFAASGGLVDIADVLLSRRAMPDLQSHPRNCGFNNGWSALHYACDNGHMELITKLIGSGANIDMPTADGDTALSIAAEAGRFDVVKWMVQAGAQVNAKRRQMNPTQWAIFRAEPEAVQFLVSHGGLPKIDHKILWFPNQETLMHRITREFDPEIIKRIDLAIYRGGKLLKERARIIKQFSNLKWLVAAKYDVNDFSATGGEMEVISLPSRVVQLISIYCEEYVETDDRDPPYSGAARPTTTESKRGHA